MTGLLARLDGLLDDLATMTLGGMADADVVRLLDAATVASSRLTSVQCRTAAEADRRRLGDSIGARHTHQWWARRSNLTRAEANRLTELGVALADDVHAPTASALAAGAIRAEQARVIVAAVDALPDRVDADVREKAESMLLDLAAQLDAKDLKQLGKQILDHVAPEVAESHEAAALEAEEARAFANVDLTLTDDGEGRCRGTFVVPSHIGKMFKRHLMALTNPARHTDADLKDETGNWKPLRRRLGEAFIEYIERYPLDATSQTAGVNATVVITMTLEQLLGDAAVALLDDGIRLTAGEARRLACEAAIIPAVLGSKSQPLDLGRSARLHSKAQRIALGLRDGGCTARGCETTASGCHAHHDDPWSKGGATDLSNGRLLCPHHHRLAHSSRYVTTIHADNTLTFILRT
ncbi:HNH endonuclease [Nocardioides oleivorans]|uniref:HNH endonuclease n=1 Tax=Nocardioides oleivorans TaxID=273676 RepID=A0A4Q2S5A1_9ACTN|nr:HNH endonuclease signature motif containing protein [Nocardioides oleivorans]RYB95539.1 HNH endonuclease [Nocardioides oleivorans]